MKEFKLPQEIASLVLARNDLRGRFSITGLKFTFDGNLVGDLGEALAAELFGIDLTPARSFEGIDGYAPDGRTVQVKATGTKRGCVFRDVKMHADHLLFFCFDFDALSAKVVYNGPEANIRQHLKSPWVGQKPVQRSRIEYENGLVEDHMRLVAIKGAE